MLTFIGLSHHPYFLQANLIRNALAELTLLSLAAAHIPEALSQISWSLKKKKCPHLESYALMLVGMQLCAEVKETNFLETAEMTQKGHQDGCLHFYMSLKLCRFWTLHFFPYISSSSLYLLFYENVWEMLFFFSFIPAISYYSWALPYCTPPQANQESREVQIFFLQYTVCVAQGCVILNSSPCCVMECFDFLNKTRRCFIAPCDKVFPIPCQRVHEFIWILFRNAPFEIWF